MALDPLELATIGAIIIVFFLWGPQKIPELARVVAQARKEFDKASKEFQNVAVGIQNGTSPLLATTPPAKKAPFPLPQQASQGVNSGTLSPPSAPVPVVKTGDQLLIEAARRLGIPTQGKTREEIQQDIITMAQRPQTSGGSPPPSTSGDSAP